MTSEWLGEMFKVDSADMCVGKFPLISSLLSLHYKSKTFYDELLLVDILLFATSSRDLLIVLFVSQLSVIVHFWSQLSLIL